MQGPGGVSVRVIPSSRENPKICGVDDAEVVGDLVAVDAPVPRHLLAQKSQYRTSEILEPSIPFVVGAGFASASFALPDFARPPVSLHRPKSDDLPEIVTMVRPQSEVGRVRRIQSRIR